MSRDRIFLRNINGDAFVEAFLIAAVLTVLTVRFFLHLTGYPQLGGSHLHVAHVLWGGLLLAVAVVILLSYLSRPAQRIAAVVGGVGFGLFIDEVGKFLTQDTDYFFLPAVSIIYIVFVLIFIGVRTIRNIRPFSQTEYLLNAIQTMQEVVVRDLDPEERDRAVRYLAASDASDPLVEPLRRVIEQTATVSPSTPRFWTRIRRGLRRLYVRVARRPRFLQAVIAFFVVQQALALAFLLFALFFHGARWEDLLSARFVRIFSRRLETLSFSGIGETVFACLSAAMAVWGILSIRRSRLAGFRMFERSVLVSVLLTQPFAFYREQFWALAGLAFNILVLITLRYMIAGERGAASARPQAQSDWAPPEDLSAGRRTIGP